jgi:hypothetical protein
VHLLSADDKSMKKVNSPTPQIISHSSYDVDGDGDIDLDDARLASKRIDDGYKEPVEDDRSNLRELKRLKAQDAIEEKLRREQEEENDRILEAERQYQREANKSGFRKKLEGGMDKVSGYIKEQRQQPAPQAPRAPRRKGSTRAPARTPTRKPVNYNEPSRRHQPAATRTPTENRFSNMSMGLKGFSAGVLGGGSGQSGSLRQADPLLNFTSGLSPKKTVSNSGQMKGSDHLLKFSSNLLGGNKSVSKSNKGRKSKSKSFLRLI